MENTITAEPVAADSVKGAVTNTVPPLPPNTPSEQSIIENAKKSAGRKNSPASRLADKLEADKPAPPPATKEEPKPIAEVKLEEINLEEPAPVVAEEIKDDKPKLTDEQRDTIKFLESDDEETVVTTTDPETTHITKEYEELKAKATQYEEKLKHPMVEAMTAFIEAGGEDFTDFAKQIGILDTANLSVEEMYRMEAKALGFEGEELEEAVQESLSDFEGLTKIQKKQKEVELRDKHKPKTSEKLTAFTKKITEERQKLIEQDNQASAKAVADLEKVTSSMIDKQYKGLLLTKEMIDRVKDVVPTLAPMIQMRDAQGNLTGYDVKRGVNLAILELYEKQLLKSTYNLGRVAAAEEFWSERNRVTPNNTQVAGPQTPGVTKEENVKTAQKSAAQRMTPKPFTTQNLTKK